MTATCAARYPGYGYVSLASYLGVSKPFLCMVSCVCVCLCAHACVLRGVSCKESASVNDAAIM